MSHRVQRKRMKGWKIPENTIYVGRPSQYGNPFRVGHHYRRCYNEGIPKWDMQYIYMEAFEGHQDSRYTTLKTKEEAVEWFRWYLSTWSSDKIDKMKMELSGKNLACWCPLDEPCHADVLLKLANK